MSTWQQYVIHKEYRVRTVGSSFEESVTQGPYHNHISFDLAVDENELFALNQIFDQWRGRVSGNCTVGLCRVLRTAQILYAPPVIRHSPSTLALYLQALRLTNSNRVTQVRGVGATPSKIIFASPNFYTEVLMNLYTWGTPAIYFLDQEPSQSMKLFLGFWATQGIMRSIFAGKDLLGFHAGP